MNPFSQQQLFQVRNEIDIDWLISDKLNLERQFNGMWRFCCPLCKQFNTATQKKTNLSRCFSCQKNFNTIDLVIYSKKINFIPSVNFLLTLLDKIKSQSNKKTMIKTKMTQCKTKKLMNKQAALQQIKKIRQMIR